MANRAAANQRLFQKPRGPQTRLNRLFGNAFRRCYDSDLAVQ
jgi:hypothetical protein